MGRIWVGGDGRGESRQAAAKNPEKVADPGERGQGMGGDRGGKTENGG